MTIKQFEIFDKFREEFREKVYEWNNRVPNLAFYQKEVAEKEKTPFYQIETPVVYNKALDSFTVNDEIKLILIGDNPGKEEQLKKNNKYLVGQAGKIAKGYFGKNPELGIDFNRNVIILNKTPIHSAKTAQLKMIAKNGGDEISNLLQESQIWMAKKTAELHNSLCLFGEKTNKTELWLVGYSELKSKGLFEEYRNTLKSSYKEGYFGNVYVFQHFSMNRFIIDLKDFEKNNKWNKTLEEKIHMLGEIHKKEIFGL